MGNIPFTFSNEEYSDMHSVGSLTGTLMLLLRDVGDDSRDEGSAVAVPLPL
jgi:hypothetical protein